MQAQRTTAQERWREPQHDGPAGTPDITFRDDTLTLPDDAPAIRLWLVPETI